MTMRTHKDLIVWQKSIALAGRIYTATGTFPNYQYDPLSNQMRRSALSVPSNIAEGAGRGTRNEYLRFLNIARGSLAELETQLHIGLELNLIDRSSALQEDISEVGRLLSALVRRLREHPERAASFAAPPCLS